MSILAHYQNQKVEVLDAYEVGGIMLASIKALEGKPFVGGDKYPIRTEYTICKAAELEQVQQDPKPSLLDLALAAAQPRWYTGESKWIYGKHAFLKEHKETVRLHLVGVSASCLIFVLSHKAGWSWQPSEWITEDYKVWVAKVNGGMPK